MCFPSKIASFGLHEPSYVWPRHVTTKKQALDRATRWSDGGRRCSPGAWWTPWTPTTLGPTRRLWPRESGWARPWFSTWGRWAVAARVRKKVSWFFFIGCRFYGPALENMRGLQQSYCSTAKVVPFKLKGSNHAQLECGWPVRSVRCSAVTLAATCMLGDHGRTWKSFCASRGRGFGLSCSNVWIVSRILVAGHAAGLISWLLTRCRCRCLWASLHPTRPFRSGDLSRLLVFLAPRARAFERTSRDFLAACLPCFPCGPFSPHPATIAPRFPTTM